jgi:hypothetical protein
MGVHIMSAGHHHGQLTELHRTNDIGGTAENRGR